MSAGKYSSRSLVEKYLARIDAIDRKGPHHGLPVGISFFGRPWSEPTLIGYAYAFEQATRARKPPRFAPSAPLR